MMLSIPAPALIGLWIVITLICIVWWSSLIKDHPDEMPGGGMKAVYIVSALWPLVVAIIVVGSVLTVLEYVHRQIRRLTKDKGDNNG